MIKLQLTHGKIYDVDGERILLEVLSFDDTFLSSSIIEIDQDEYKSLQPILDKIQDGFNILLQALDKDNEKRTGH